MWAPENVDMEQGMIPRDRAAYLVRMHANVSTGARVETLWRCNHECVGACSVERQRVDCSKLLKWGTYPANVAPAGVSAMGAT